MFEGTAWKLVVLHCLSVILGRCQSIDIEWNNLSILKCYDATNHYVSLLHCLPPEETFPINLISCVFDETYILDEAVCRPTTTELQTTIETTKPWIAGDFECSDKRYIGQSCNITDDPCQMAEVCQNKGTCVWSQVHPLGYVCKCPLQFSGVYCEEDDRICKNNTCWHDGRCLEVNNPISVENKTDYECLCTPGYDGMNCQLITNMCENIVCENNGRCLPSHLEWSCQCLGDSLYSGEFCQHKSSELVAKEILSKSFAFVAITAIIVVFIFVFTMDILKYFFGIDPVEQERKLIKSGQQKKKKESSKNKSKKSKARAKNTEIYFIS